jgi:hypothetical protein
VTTGPTPDEPDPRIAEAGGGSLTGRARRRAARAGAAAQAWLDQRRGRVLPIDLAVTFYERDRDQFASVLGAAVALRLFLFIVPATVTVVGLVVLVAGQGGMVGAMRQASVTGSLAAQVRDATDVSRSAGLAVFVSGLWLSVWAGRSLAQVLAACAAQAWRMPGREHRMTLRRAGAVTALALLLLVVSALLNRVRAQLGVAAGTATWFTAVAAYTAGWFALSLTLPRRTADPGALLPGAVFVGAALSALQWVMQFLLPGRISRASDLMGSLGLAVATLGYAFLVGRIMAASFIVDAIVWERLGSVSGLVFSLPGLRRLPARYPSVARFFDLDDTAEERERRRD